MSCIEASCGKLIVFETLESTCFWKAACILMCHSGEMSCATTNTLLMWSGISAKPWIDPAFAIFCISSFE